MSDIFPVVFGICVDAEAAWIGRDPKNATRPVLLSNGTFGIYEGLPALLDLLDEKGVKASFFVPGLATERHPDAIREVAKRGHEVGSHGMNHRAVSGLSEAEERSELVGGIEALEKVLGTRPTAWRSAGWDWSERTLDLVLDEGVTVSTNFHDRARPYRHMKDGVPVPLVEVPVQWHLADAPFFTYGGQVGRVIRPAGEVQTIWEDEFEGLYEWPGAFYHLTLHVELIGHPGRLKMLARHIDTLKARSRTRFMTASELAETVA
ncbi:MAG: polysaccharide deacetylase family protein [Pseudomonadota bacterium]